MIKALKSRLHRQSRLILQGLLHISIQWSLHHNWISPFQKTNEHNEGQAPVSSVLIERQPHQQNSSRLTQSNSDTGMGPAVDRKKRKRRDLLQKDSDFRINSHKICRGKGQNPIGIRLLTPQGHANSGSNSLDGRRQPSAQADGGNPLPWVRPLALDSMNAEPPKSVAAAAEEG